MSILSLTQWNPSNLGCLQLCVSCYPAAQCEQLPDIQFGSVSQTGVAVGDTATYTCDPGFDLVAIGPPTRTCTQIDPDTAVFNGQEPFCRRTCLYCLILTVHAQWNPSNLGCLQLCISCYPAAQCEQLPDIQFGSVSQTGVAVGDTATYTCDPGFDLVGSPTRTCTQIINGGVTFNGQEPFCRRTCLYSLILTQWNPSNLGCLQLCVSCYPAAQCEQLPDIQFGSVSQTGVAVGDTATYTCDPGFDLVAIGPPTRTCTQIDPDTAVFNGQEPFCRRTCLYSLILTQWNPSNLGCLQLCFLLPCSSM